MTFKEYLEDCIKKYYKHILIKYKFTLVESDDNGIASLRGYQNDSFKIRIVNDRGIVNGEIASIIDSDNYFDIGLFFIYFNLIEVGAQKINQWDRKMILKKIVSCEEEASCIDTHYIEICNMLSTDQYHLIKEELRRIANLRSGRIVG